MVTSIRIGKGAEPLFKNLVDVCIVGDDLTHFGVPGPKGQLLLERVAQICLEAREEIDEAAE
jgi:hypothetical protein